jgi:hypothetical protein
MMDLLALILLGTVPLAFIRPLGRLVFFVLGLLFFVVVSLGPMGSAGLHGEGIIVAVPGLMVCVAAIIAELAVRALRLARHRTP